MISQSARSVLGTSVYLIPGQSVKIGAEGFFIRVLDVKIERDGEIESVKLTNGFCVLDSKVGTIEAVSGEASVIYKHKKAESNTIVFYARTGEVGFCNVISVPIHTHENLTQGGPAFGTFMSDDREDLE
jgi:hypothetical protein